MRPHPGTNSVSIFARTPQLAADEMECVVTVPTFKRPEHLLRTLQSIVAQETERRFAVIVVENEPKSVREPKRQPPFS